MISRSVHSSKRFASFTRRSTNRLQNSEQTFFRINHQAKRNMRTAIVSQVSSLPSRVLTSPEINITRGFEIDEDDDGG